MYVKLAEGANNEENSAIFLFISRCRLRYNRTDTTHEIRLRLISRERGAHKLGVFAAQPPLAFRILDTQGRLIHEAQSQENNMEMDITALLPGFYFLHFSDGSVLKWMKI